jgi:hypothetical protein
MRKKEIQFNDAIFQHKIRTLSKKFNLDEKEFVKDQGGLFMRDLARYIPPYKSFPMKGTTLGNKADLKAGKLAIKYDLTNLFFVPDARVFAWAKRTFSGEIRKGKKVIGAGIIESIGEMKRFHNANRKPRTGRCKSLRGWQKMWVDESMFQTYTFMVQRDVGVAKASMAKGMIMLKPKVKGIPAWVRAQMSKATGRASMVKDARGWSAIFKATAFGLQHVSQGSIRIVQRGRLKAMETRLKHIFRQAAKESGWKVK